MSNNMSERDYWRDPVQVFSGLIWLLAGIVIGVLI